MFVMIPQAFSLVELGPENDYKVKCWIIICALYAFLAVDRILMYGILLKKKRENHRKIHVSTIESILSRQNSVIDRQSEVGSEADEREEIMAELEVAMINNDLTRRLSSRRQIAMLQTNDRLEGVNFGEDNQRKRSGEEPGFLRVFNNEVVHRRSPPLRFMTPTEEHQKSSGSLENLTQNGMAPQILINGKKMGTKNKDDQISVDINIVEKKVIRSPKDEIANVAYMIIFGSSANNFVDGMSVGAAFADDIMNGFSVGSAILTNQFPQELGTLAILINSGLGYKKALLFNLIPIVLSYIGFGVGVILDRVNESYDDYIFALSAGMYLYIFLGTLIPEIRDACQELAKENLGESLLVTVLQVLGIVVGIGFVFMMGELKSSS
ncbi:unnamed protein product, partial [Mesorhabditis spiculigera]